MWPRRERPLSESCIEWQLASLQQGFLLFASQRNRVHGLFRVCLFLEAHGLKDLQDSGLFAFLMFKMKSVAYTRWEWKMPLPPSQSTSWEIPYLDWHPALLFSTKIHPFTEIILQYGVVEREGAWGWDLPHGSASCCWPRVTCITSLSFPCSPRKIGGRLYGIIIWSKICGNYSA